MPRKDRATNKDILPRGLLSILDHVKKSECSCWACCCTAEPAARPAAGPAAAATAAAAAGAAGSCWASTLQHHATEGRNDLKKHATQKLDVPSGFWQKTKRVQLLGLLLLLLLLLLELVLQAPKTYSSPH